MHIELRKKSGSIRHNTHITHMPCMYSHVHTHTHKHEHTHTCLHTIVASRVRLLLNFSPIGHIFPMLLLLGDHVQLGEFVHIRVTV